MCIRRTPLLIKTENPEEHDYLHNCIIGLASGEKKSKGPRNHELDGYPVYDVSGITQITDESDDSDFEGPCKSLLWNKYLKGSSNE